MPIQEINVGSGPGAGNGETLYNAFVKVNSNTTILAADNATALTVAGNANTTAGAAQTEAAAAKIVADAATLAIAAKAPINNPTFTGTVGGLNASMVGLGNVTNKSELNLAVSTATQAAINAADILSLKTGDLYDDFVASGLTTSLPSASLTAVLSSGIAYIGGNRVVIANNSFPYIAARDTYVDISNTGTVTRVAVLNGAAEPLVTANSLRIEKVVTGATVTSITRLANRTLLMARRDNSGNISSLYDPVTNVDIPLGGLLETTPGSGIYSASVSPRTGILGSKVSSTGLLAIINAGSSEIARATDIEAEVWYPQTIGNPARISYRNKFIGSMGIKYPSQTVLTGASPLGYPISEGDSIFGIKGGTTTAIATDDGTKLTISWPSHNMTSGQSIAYSEGSEQMWSPGIAVITKIDNNTFTIPVTSGGPLVNVLISMGRGTIDFIVLPIMENTVLGYSIAYVKANAAIQLSAPTTGSYCKVALARNDAGTSASSNSALSSSIYNNYYPTTVPLVKNAASGLYSACTATLHAAKITSTQGPLFMYSFLTHDVTGGIVIANNSWLELEFYSG